MASLKRYSDCEFNLGSGGFFGAFRTKPFNTYYCPSPTAVTQDKVEIALVVFVISLVFLGLLVSPAYRRWQRVFFLCKIIGTMFVGGAILLSDFGYAWQTGTIHTKTPYRQFTKEEINASVGLHVGLRGINVTLKGEPIDQAVDPRHENKEHIDYNERFNWGWQQFRIGFGPYSNELNREFRAAQWRGLPLPILWIAEYFTLDAENILWGRMFRNAGFYTNIMLWTSFTLWLVANFLFIAAPKAGTYVFGLIGVILLTGIIIYSAVVSNSDVPDLRIPFEGGYITLSYGWSYWLVLVAGIFCVVTCLVFLLLEFRFPIAFYTFFDVSVDDEIIGEEAIGDDDDDDDDEDDEDELPRPMKRHFTNAFGFSTRYRAPKRKPLDSNDAVYGNNGAGGGRVREDPVTTSEKEKGGIALEEIKPTTGGGAENDATHM